jgi:putative transposase
MIDVSTSAYYYKPKVKREDREKDDASLRELIEKVQLEFPKAGYRVVRIHLLRQLGLLVNWKKIRRIMSKYSLYAEIKHAFHITTNSNHNFKVYPNLIQGKEVTDINQVWVADITYIRICHGHVYLAVILDIFSRRVIGWSLSKDLSHGFVVDALKAAIEKRKPGAGLIHHSDRGIQYACKEYVELLKSNNSQISMSRKGNPYDNAFAESFFKTLKKEEVYLWNYEDVVDVAERIPYFIEDVYNKKRVHSGIGYLPPEEFEEMLKDENKRKELGIAPLKIK